jgi:hypothetical protein
MPFDTASSQVVRAPRLAPRLASGMTRFQSPCRVMRAFVLQASSASRVGSSVLTRPGGSSSIGPGQAGGGTLPTKFHGGLDSKHSMNRVSRRAIDARLRRQSFDDFPIPATPKSQEIA